MKESEIKPIMERVAKYRKLEERQQSLAIAKSQLNSIRGTNDEIKTIRSIEACLHNTNQLRIEGGEFTTWELREALLPLVERNLEAVIKEMEAL